MTAAFGPTDEIVGKLNPLKCCKDKQSRILDIMLFISWNTKL